MTKEMNPYRCFGGIPCDHHHLVGRIPDIHDCNISNHTPSKAERECIDYFGCTKHSAFAQMESENDWLKLICSVEALGCSKCGPEQRNKCDQGHYCLRTKELIQEHDRRVSAASLEAQCIRVGEKLINDKCVPDGDCGKCILCDNTGGCLAESSIQVQKALANEASKLQQLRIRIKQAQIKEFKNQEKIVEIIIGWINEWCEDKIT